MKPGSQPLVDHHGTPQSASRIFSRSNERPKDAKPDSTPRSESHPDKYRAIHHFLDASMPPMTHLMDAIIDYGCINADFFACYLLVVASEDQIRPGATSARR